MELPIAALVLVSVYLLDEQRLNQIVAWVQEFIDYLERQQQQQG